MAMTAVLSDQVSFSCPTITPKHYMVKGPSGWPETFERKKLDAELAVFLSPVPPKEMADVFLQSRALLDKPEPATWFTVIGFLGRTLGVSPRAIPGTVSIAFWAAIVLAEREKAAN